MPLLRGGIMDGSNSVDAEEFNLGTKDPVTGFNNKPYFLFYLARGLEEAREYGYDLNLIIITAPHARQIKDIAALVEQQKITDIRGSDGGKTIFLRTRYPEEQANVYAERLRQELLKQGYQAKVGVRHSKGKGETHDETQFESALEAALANFDGNSVLVFDK